MPITNQVSEFQSSQSQAHLDSILWLLFLDDLDLNGKCGHNLPVTLFWRDLNVLGTILWIDLYVSISAPQLTEKCNYLLYFSQSLYSIDKVLQSRTLKLTLSKWKEISILQDAVAHHSTVLFLLFFILQILFTSLFKFPFNIRVTWCIHSFREHLYCIFLSVTGFSIYSPLKVNKKWKKVL